MIGKGNSLKEKSVSKYESFYFWENLIHKEEPLWENGFQNKPLTESSIYIYTVLMDHNKDFLKSKWAYYPDVYALLGFLQYVFLPTSFFTWLDNDVDGFNIPLTTGEELLQIMLEVEKTLDPWEIGLMKTQLEEVKAFWQLSEEACLEKIHQFSVAFNQSWIGKSDKLVYFKIFQTPVDIGKYVLQGGEIAGEGFTEVMEEEIEMTKAQWEDVYQKVYQDPFMRKKFIDILNYKIGCLV
ncbi:hypothetical protein [Anaerovirgula multivorans]|nr:hypothetical protein [Anaerovirgula multivorans]